MLFKVLESFYDNASICMGLEINLPQNVEVRQELTSLCKVMAQDGVSLMARDVQLDKIIGIAFNKIQVGVPDISYVPIFLTSDFTI